MTKINEDNIRMAAYYIWEQAGCPEGEEKECWIKACEQLFAAKPTESKLATKKEPVKKTADKAAIKTPVKPVAKSATITKPATATTPFYGVKKK